MLSIVRETLLESKLISPSAEITYNIAISTGDTISFDLRCPEKGWFHVKASRYSNLAEQFESYRLAHSRFGEIVPEPLAHYLSSGWSILIARSVAFRPLRASDITDPSLRTCSQRNLIEFFDTARATTPQNVADAESDQFSHTLKDFFAHTRGKDSTEYRYLEKISSSEWSSIPFIPQHGDFALNNVGTLGSRLVIFDWEDYGATNAAGFDIFIMSLSISGLDGTVLRSMQETANPAGMPWAIALPACETTGLEYTDFRRWIPVYLLIFRYLKRNYASQIQHLTDRLLANVLV